MKRREFLTIPALGAVASSALRDPLSLLRGYDDQNAADTSPRAAWEAHRQRLHPDFETYAPGIEYFILGNGEIQGVLQYMPDRSGPQPMTFLGLTLMDAERFARKWSTFLFHPERGLDRSMATVVVDEKGYTATPESVSRVGWTYPEGIPSVTLEWKAGVCSVREELAVPHKGRFLVRRVFVTNPTERGVMAKVLLALVPSFAIFDDIGINRREGSVEASGFTGLKLYALESNVATSGRYDLTVNTGEVPAGRTREVVFVYQFDRRRPALTRSVLGSLWKETGGYWKKKHEVVTGDAMLDHLYAVSRTGIKAGISTNGKRDSGIWMYNMEWVRDDMMVMLGLLHAGFADEARTMLVKTLERSVGPDGCAIESSRWSGPDLTELDQNGEILYGAWAYLCWTGDRALIRKHWKKISLTADYPLQEVFWDKKSSMLRNKREYWERGGENFGIEDGFELTYQMWVVLGLEKAAAMADLLGEGVAARRWSAAAAKIRHGMLEDPAYRLIENGMLIKRRKRDGVWQQHALPANRSALPPGSPLATNEKPAIDPDTSSAYPIMYGLIDPGSDLARKTLESMEILWNQSWTHGGYSRYNTTSEPDPPAPWPLATVFLARAFTEAGMDEKAWRALRWVYDIHGGKGGAWFERMGPSITPPAPPVCIVGWVWAELNLLFVQHFAGVRPGIDRLQIRPRLLKGMKGLNGEVRVRGAEISLAFRAGTGAQRAAINGKPAEMRDGALVLNFPKKGTRTKIEIDLE
jgi:hypothetical protein